MSSLTHPQPGGYPADDGDLQDRMASLGGRLNALHAELIDEIAFAIDTGEWMGDGYKSVAHWLTIQLGVSSGHARQLEATARRVGEFPLTADKFRAGLLSHDQFNTAVADAPSWADIHTFDLIEHATVPQIRRIIRAQFPSAGTNANDADGAQPGHEPGEASTTSNADVADPFREYFSFGWTVDGRFTGSFDLAAPSGAILDSALTEARDHLFQQHNRHQHNKHHHYEADLCNTPTATWPHALVDLAQRSLGSTSASRVDRFRHYLHIDIGKWDAPLPGLITTLSGQIYLPQAVAQYMSCDCTMQPVWERDNTPIGVGRATRSIPNLLRRHIEHRDKGCCVPGCGATIVQIHHIVHWSDGGVTESWNLISLCSKHHQMHHAGRLNISGNPDLGTIVFRDRDGHPMQAGPKPTAPSRADAQHSTQSAPVFRRPACEPLRLKWFSKWEPPDRDPTLSPPLSRAWEQHQRCRKRSDDPPPSEPDTAA